MSKLWRVKAANMSATYTAGVYLADTAAEACELARDNYRDSALGRTLKDTGAFRFWAVPCRCEEEE
jgi:hypothetical protein